MALVWSFLANLLTFAVLLHAQPGFISIDCGRHDTSSFLDRDTNITYAPDATFIQTGENKYVAINSEDHLPWIYESLRSFPIGGRNCYDLRDVKKGNKYLIRAYFMYGNYDSRNSTPEFALYIGVNFWRDISFSKVTIPFYKEIIIATTTNYISICLMDTGSGTPFISALELRPLNNSMYDAVNESQSLQSAGSYSSPMDLGVSKDDVIDKKFFRYPTEPLDLIWTREFNGDWWIPLKTSKKVTNKNGALEPSSSVMMTAVRPLDDNDTVPYYWADSDSSVQYRVYLHFAELEILGPKAVREFTVCCGGSCYGEPVRPEYLVTTTIQIPKPLSGQNIYSCSIKKTPNSNLPPILNALEIFTISQLTKRPTREQDVEAMFDIRATYKVERNWMGDPCVPEMYSWNGLTCKYTDAPTIVSLNLSSTRLKGEIAASLANLTSIQSLDLSWNNLTGPIPNFLGDLPFLSSLNLSGNQLSGSVPSNLLEKSKKGSLKLSVDNSPDLCVFDSCGRDSNKQKIIILIVAPVASIVILLILLIILRRFKWRKQDPVVKANKTEGLFCSENRRFTYAEVITLTNNLERVIGKGGFGTVYYGQMLNGTHSTQVAVKLLSHKCQGSNEFQNEVQLLIRVHHRNVVSLIGYCQEGDSTALIYEYMAQGDLGSHLLGTRNNSNPLNWGQRLQIALDVAQGLEYLHTGCQPSIIHRDMKTANILLNERFEAKIGDFGLSKVFFNDDEQTHISTLVKGTRAYLDPEYLHSNHLTQKSDVYGFGVVLLEMITGQPPIIRSRTNHEKKSLVDWARPTMATGDIQAVLDPRLEGDCDANSLSKVAEIALACTSPRSIERPTMTDIVAELKGCLGTETAVEIRRSPEIEHGGVMSSDSSILFPR